MTKKMNVTGAVLVSLTISEFGNNKRDEGATQDVVERNHLTDSTVARVWKTLLPKGSAIDQVRTAISALRNFHYKNTHAYVHDGPRILTTKNYADYQQGLRKLDDELQVAVLNLVSDFEALKNSAQHKLGNLFQDADYPTSEGLQNSYKVTAIYSPMPATDNLLDLGLEPADMARMRAQLEQELQTAFQSANRKMWAELHDRLSTLVSQMGNEKSSVHPKTLEGITSLVEMLPRLNLTNDDALDAMSNRLTSMLTAMQSSAFRHDPELKSKVASEARAVYGVMSSFMNAKRRAPAPLEALVAQA